MSTHEPVTGRDRKREATRHRLLDAGLRLFAERGYHAVTAAEIADAAGVTERTFFRHFPTSTASVVDGRLRRELAGAHHAGRRPRLGALGVG